ncbi:MAG: chemotaxis protein CheW [Fimbriimonadaceae bacterium]|nr:chemotaxis protein CheW [Alphaproteobacteria bacterium]
MKDASQANIDEDVIEFITATIGGQVFGVPISQVQDVFTPEMMTKVPLAAPEIAGVLNLRGRIVTAIDMRQRLSLPIDEHENDRMAVGIESNNESYGLLIDSIGEVLRLKKSDLEPNPANLDSRWSRVSAGVYRLEGNLLVVLDVRNVLDFIKEPLAA